GSARSNAFGGTKNRPICASAATAARTRRSSASLDAAAGRFPIGVAQFALHDLAVILARETHLEPDHARHLEIGEPLREVCAHEPLVERGTGLRFDISAELFAERLVRDAERGAIAHAR